MRWTAYSTGVLLLVAIFAWNISRLSRWVRRDDHSINSVANPTLLRKEAGPGNDELINTGTDSNETAAEVVRKDDALSDRSDINDNADDKSSERSHSSPPSSRNGGKLEVSSKVEESTDREPCDPNIDKILSEFKARRDPHLTCRERVRRGENVLLYHVLEFAREWNTKHAKPFFCDLLWGPKEMMIKTWPEVDFIFGRDDAFSWKQFAKVPSSQTKVLYFPNGKQYCEMLDLAALNEYVNFKFIVIGPFGDNDNFGPFSGGKYSPYFKAKPHELVMRLMCQKATWNDLMAFLEDDRVIAWISFQQTIEHPKVISVPIGISPPFRRYAIEDGNLKDSLYATKDKLLGVTFETFYSDRKEWIEGINNATYLNQSTVEYTKMNPFHKEDVGNMSEIEAWKLALETPRKSRIIVAPGGLGVDTKRPAESILVGSVPLHLISNGLYKTYRNLPVLWSFSYSEFYGLQGRLEDLLCTGKKFDFGKLTVEGWHEFVRDLKSGTVIVDAFR